MPYIDDAYIEALRKHLDGQSISEDTEPRRAPRADMTTRTAASATGKGQPACSGAHEQEPWMGAYKKILRLANVSERSVKGLRERLLREGFDAESLDTALERACSYGIVDDVRYAEVLVRSRISAGKGRQGIEAELRALDIDPCCVEVWDEYLAGESELDRALALLRRRPPTAKNKRDAAYRRLVSKGYSSSTAQSAARIWSESA